MPELTREVIRAVLEARDHRHNETHGALLSLYQALVEELVCSGRLEPLSLADRLEPAHHRVTEGPHGDTARNMIRQVTEWLRGGASSDGRPALCRPAPLEDFDGG